MSRFVSLSIRKHSNAREAIDLGAPEMVAPLNLIARRIMRILAGVGSDTNTGSSGGKTNE